MSLMFPSDVQILTVVADYHLLCTKLVEQISTHRSMSSYKSLYWTLQFSFSFCLTFVCFVMLENYRMSIR